MSTSTIPIPIPFRVDADARQLQFLLDGAPRAANVEYQQAQLACLLRIEAALERCAESLEQIATAPADKVPSSKPRK